MPIFDLYSLFDVAQQTIAAMSNDFGVAFMGLIILLLIIQGLDVLTEIFLPRLNQKSEDEEYEQWKANREKMQRWEATYNAENNYHGPAAPERKDKTGYL